MEEQVKSLGAQFFKIDLGETGQTKDGYAGADRGTDPEAARRDEKNLRRFRRGHHRRPGVGRRAPVLVTAEMLNAMKPGSVVVDLAVETGGNVAGVVYDQVTDRNNGVTLAMSGTPLALEGAAPSDEAGRPPERRASGRLSTASMGSRRSTAASSPAIHPSWPVKQS